MRSLSLLPLTALLLAAPLASLRAHEQPEPPVPVHVAPDAPAAVAPRVGEEQRLYGPSNATLIPAEQAQALVSRFKEAYVKMGSPRLVFHINRELVDTSSGLRLTARTERTESTRSETKSTLEPPAASSAPTAPAQTQVNISVNGDTPTPTLAPQSGKGETSTTTTRTTGENTYALKDADKLSLADRQTTREVERLFGRVFRAGGALLADQKAAAALLEDKPVASLSGTSDQASKDREALAKVADVAIEILISSRAITVPAVSGDQQTTVPDIQATAIRLSDAAILAQAAATDILGKDATAARVIQNFDVRDITEATALALMEDMITHLKADK